MILRPAKVGFVLGAMLLVFLACDRSPTDPVDLSLSFQTVFKTSSLPGFSPDLQGREAIRDRATWQAVWAELHGGIPASPPEVDFNREMVIVVVGLGCGGDTTISSVDRGNSELVVNALTRSCIFAVCGVADFSVHAVRVPRVEVPVRLNLSRNEGFC